MLSQSIRSRGYLWITFLLTITMSTMYSYAHNMSEPVWMTTEDVRNYVPTLRNRSLKWAQVWMWRNRVRRSSANNRMTCKEWVDAALNRKVKRNRR